MNPIIVDKKQQSFGKDPLEVRESDHYQHEYVTPFVEKWDELIDWEKRAESEGRFIIDKLKERNVEKVLDIATGTGFHSVRLLKAGFNVVSVDGNAEMLTKAFENARRYNYILNTVHADWRWLTREVKERFDAVICLGNSFTHLFSERVRRKALAEIYSVLKYDGILILDQRNYDAILECGFSCKHKYHYCGDDVIAEPEHIDEGLARFKYVFKDNSIYHLNMFPLRKKYVRKLMREVGFQHIDTYGDLMETYQESDPDFFTHVAKKVYEPKTYSIPEKKGIYSDSVNRARQYYNSSDADNFYFTIWGGEDIHIGLYESEEESIYIASRRTVEKMASRLKIDNKTKILDLGSGYGGTARFLAKTYGCQVTALNLSEIENQRNREMTRAQGLEHLVDIVDGSFEDVPFSDATYDIIWSQDAILHSGDRKTVIEEVARLLKTGGDFIFTDPMQTENCSKNDLQPIYDRIHLESLGSVQFYRSRANRYGLKEIGYEDYSNQMATHYSRVGKETEKRESDLKQSVSELYITNMKKGLKYWVDGVENGCLKWGIFHFKKR